jgi:hypothetical protein
LGLEAFRQNVNRPNTIFSRDHWLLPKLERLRELMADPLPADQAQAILDVLHYRRWMADLIPWLEAPEGLTIEEHVAQREQLRLAERLHRRVWRPIRFSNEYDCLWLSNGPRAGINA